MKIITFVFLFLILIGCASQKKEQQIIQDKVSQEAGSADKDGLAKTIHELINSSKTLTEAQKNKLNGIFEANKLKSFTLSEESYKLRSVLVKELLSGNVNQKRIKLIKKDIKKVERLRLKNTFEIVEKVSAIVSKYPDNQSYTNHLLFMERPFLK